MSFRGRIASVEIVAGAGVLTVTLAVLVSWAAAAPLGRSRAPKQGAGEASDPFRGFVAVTHGDLVSDMEASRIAGVTSGTSCADDPDAQLMMRIGADVDASRPGREAVFVSLARGVVALSGPSVVARTVADELECVGSQAFLDGVSAGQVVGDSDEEIVVYSEHGSHRETWRIVQVLKRIGSRFVSVLTWGEHLPARLVRPGHIRVGTRGYDWFPRFGLFATRTGGLTRQQIRDAITPQQGAFSEADCPESTDCDLGQFDVVVEIAVGAGGEVLGTAVVRNGGGATWPDTAECVARTVRGWRFPPPRVAPFVFRQTFVMGTNCA